MSYSDAHPSPYAPHSQGSHCGLEKPAGQRHVPFMHSPRLSPPQSESRRQSSPPQPSWQRHVPSRKQLQSRTRPSDQKSTEAKAIYAKSCVPCFSRDTTPYVDNTPSVIIANGLSDTLGAAIRATETASPHLADSTLKSFIAAACSASRTSTVGIDRAQETGCQHFSRILPRPAPCQTCRFKLLTAPGHRAVPCFQRKVRPSDPSLPVAKEQAESPSGRTTTMTN